MTALKEYQRLEAPGLWRSAPDAQRRDVYVSIGEATLTISDFNNQALTHWSLAAIGRLNPGELPALFHPDGDPGETLEISENEGEMIEAIERLRKAVDRARPRVGRLRLVSGLVVAVLVLAGLFLWLPGGMQRHALSVVPEVTQHKIGAALLEEMERMTGAACANRIARPGLRRLADRMEADELVVLPSGLTGALALPGGVIALGRSLVEDHEDPSVVAGFILQEQVRSRMIDPLSKLLKDGGISASFALLTSGDIPRDTLRRHAELRLSQAGEPVAPEVLLAAFQAASIPSTPYAYALDPSGESTLALIEGDPMAGLAPPPVLRDRDWVQLQAVCDGQGG
jgi:hypothetical protein